jgi:hypothetical protein
MTTTTLLTEQTLSSKANCNLLHWATLGPTALPLPPANSAHYEPAFLDDGDLHVLNPAFLSKRVGAGINNISVNNDNDDDNGNDNDKRNLKTLSTDFRS